MLGELSQGLRGAGAVLNPQVADQLGRERQVGLAQEANLKSQVVNRVMSGIESGAIDPELGQQTLASLGVRVPQGAIGPGPEAKLRAEAASREKAMREELAALGPEATQEQLAQVAARYGSANTILTTQQNSLDRRAAQEAAVVARRERLAADMELARQRGADQRELKQMQIDAANEMRRLIIGSRPGPAPTTITNGDGVFRVGADNVAVPVVGPDGKPISGKTNADRVIPSPIVRAYTENTQAIRKIDDALDALEKNPKAVGLDKSMVGDEIAQRIDPKGVVTRALINDIGSLKIHDRSGAAVTAAEFPRLKPFIPKTSDTAETAKKKLGLFRKEYKAIQDDLEGIYNADQGYKPFPKAGGSPPAPAGSAPPPPPGFTTDK